MADLNCPNCGAKFSAQDQRKTSDHWFKIGSCPKCREGVLEPERAETFSLAQTLGLSGTLIAAIVAALVLHSYGLAEWTSAAMLVYAGVFGLAFYIPVYFLVRSLFSPTESG